MREIIQGKLREIEEKENVRILCAVESGSRAWGFASPDSDYDVRFIYLRTPEDYLLLKPKRDVIEWQLDETLDINGWDISKTLKLLYRANPTVFEWLHSPIVYRESPELDSLRLLSQRYFSPRKNLYHYWHMAEQAYKTHLQTDRVRIKKYFYVLRPILCAKWVIERKSIPPVPFSELVQSELEGTMRPIVEELVELKGRTPEMGTAPQIKPLHRYIDGALKEIRFCADHMQEEKQSDWSALDAYFLSLLRQRKTGNTL